MAVTAQTDGLDIVVERVADHQRLGIVADAYRFKYGWPVTVREGAFDAPYGAPSAGLPPYHVYRVAPSVVHGFGTNETYAPMSTQWRF